MQTKFIATNDIYRRVLAEPDGEARQRLYQEQLMQPWAQMMAMFAQADDPLAGARAWNWLLPDQTEQIAELLDALEAVQAWRRGAVALERAAARFAAYAGRISIDEVEGWLVLADPARSNPYERGYTGATDWFAPRLIGQFWELDEYIVNAGSLPRLEALFAHEFHHLVRLRAFPWDMHGTTVADYIVLEGTAEAFAAELFGEESVGYFISEFDPAGLEQARRLIGGALERTGFNVIRGYIFGDALAKRAGFEPVGGMPTYGGYATGYRVVRAFMQRQGCSIEETTFLPAQEIVAGSGYFERL